MTRFAADVEDLLRGAGWSPERKVDVAEWIDQFQQAGLPAHEAAIKFLGEFGRLHFWNPGPDTTNPNPSFHFDPAECEGEEDRFLAWSEVVERSLFPVGEVGTFAFLGIDETGELYLVETFVATYGSMPTAMENLVRGVEPTDVAQ